MPFYRFGLRLGLYGQEDPLIWLLMFNLLSAHLVYETGFLFGYLPSFSN